MNLNLVNANTTEDIMLMAFGSLEWFKEAMESVPKLVILQDRKKETLTSIILQSIKPESTVFTNGWRGYCRLNEYFLDHGTVNHSLWFKDPMTSVLTNTIEGTWSGVKTTVPHRGRTMDKLNRYILRYMLKNNEGGNCLHVLINFYFCWCVFLCLKIHF